MSKFSLQTPGPFIAYWLHRSSWFFSAIALFFAAYLTLWNQWTPWLIVGGVIALGFQFKAARVGLWIFAGCLAFGNGLISAGVFDKAGAALSSALEPLGGLSALLGSLIVVGAVVWGLSHMAKSTFKDTKGFLKGDSKGNK